MSNHSIAGDYIAHLRRKVSKADHDRQHKGAIRDSKKSYNENAAAWRETLKAYFERVEATQKLYDKVDKDIEKLAAQAQTVNANVEQIVEAIKLLVCNIRYVSQSLDNLTQKYQSIKNDIDNAGMVSKSFKPNVFMNAFNTLGGDSGKLNKASIACAEALTKSLDLLKAIFILHYGMDSSQMSDAKTYRITKILDESVTVGEDEIVFTTIFETIEAKILGHEVKIPGGLEWLLAQLTTVLKEGLAQPDLDPDGDHYPCDNTGRVIPGFPLKGPGRYYNTTEHQYNKSKKEADFAEKELSRTEKDLQQAESNYNGLKAALDAAEAARNQAKK